MGSFVNLFIYASVVLGSWFFLWEVRAEDKIVSTSSGNDTYNFYFQKAPGPQTVNQGTAAMPAATPAASAPSAAGSTPINAAPVSTAVEETKNSDERPLSMGLEYGALKSAAGEFSTAGIALQYNLSSAIAFLGAYHQVISTKEARNYNYLVRKPTFDDRSPPSKNENFQESSTWNFGLLVAPLATTLYKSLSIRAGASVGLISAHIDKHDIPKMGVGNAVVYESPPNVEKRVTYFFGPHVSFNLAQNWDINLNARFADSKNASFRIKNYTGGLSYRF